MEDNKLPCGFDANSLDCSDCCGYGECQHTKNISVNDQLADALKSVGIIDIEAIKRTFDK